MNILLVKFMVKLWHRLQWRPINQDRGSSSSINDPGGWGRDVGLLSTVVPQASENARQTAFHSVSDVEGPGCRAATRTRQERCTVKTD